VVVKKKVRIKKIRSMYLISIMDISNFMGLNNYSGGAHNLEAIEHIEKIIKSLSRRVDLPIANIKTDHYHKTLRLYYYFDGGVCEITLSDIAVMEFFFTDKKLANKFRIALRKYFHKHIEEEEHIKGIFLDSIQVLERGSSLASSLREAPLISKIAHRSLSLMLISLALFAIIEISKAFFTEIFVGFFGMHKFIVIIIIAVIVAFLFRPLERLIDYLIARLVLRK
jgi:hypothetical protein